MTSTPLKYYTILSFVVLFCAHCESTKRVPSRKEYKAIYIDQFKLAYFRQLLIKGYNNTQSIQEIIKFDHSGFTERILNENDFILIDSLTAVDNNQMVADSIGGNRRAEGSQGKRPLGFILEKLSSKWLDSLANERYKKAGIKILY